MWNAFVWSKLRCLENSDIIRVPQVFSMSCDIPYSTKLWREKTLADLVVHCQSAKVLSAKKLLGLVSSNIKWALPLPTAKVFSANILAVPTPPKFYPAKVLCYTVYISHS